MNALSRAALVAAAVTLLVSACSADDSSTQASQLSVSDAWAKSADEGMSAAFGVITNDGESDVTIVGAHSDASPELQLHEVVDDMMREVDGGFVVPAGESLTLEPGGFHIMFMDLPQPLIAGDDLTITLELADGSELDFTAVVKDFSGGNEQYDGGMGDMDGMGDMSPTPSMGDK